MFGTEIPDLQWCEVRRSNITVDHSTLLVTLSIHVGEAMNANRSPPFFYRGTNGLDPLLQAHAVGIGTAGAQQFVFLR
jgi:hypothetical protein